MRRGEKSVIQGIFFLFLMISTISQGVSMLEEIIAGMKHNESLLKDWKVVCIEKSRNIDKPSFNKYLLIWAKKGDKLYREKKIGDKVVNVVSFDGEVIRVLGKNNKALIDVPTESILMNVFCGSPCLLHLFQIPFFQFKPWWEILNDRENFITSVSQTIEKTKSQSCFVVEIIQKNSDFKYILWIAPDKGFRPIKTIMISKHTKYLFTTKYEKFDRVWFPISGKVEGEVRDDDGEILVHGIIEFELKNIEINKGISDSFFQIKFPKGTKVYDERTGVSYIVK